MSLSWFDRAIATVAPRAATRRVLARQAFGARPPFSALIASGLLWAMAFAAFG